MLNKVYIIHTKVDLPPPVHFSKCTTRFPYKTYGVRKRNLGKSSINRQIQKYVANHNKDGPKTKLKMKKFLTALSSVLYFMFYFPPYVLYGKRVVQIEKWTGGGKSTLLPSMKCWPDSGRKKFPLLSTHSITLTVLIQFQTTTYTTTRLSYVC